jgi:Ser/Thr protein kinase RdoA (MazF antagonist)
MADTIPRELLKAIALSIKVNQTDLVAEKISTGLINHSFRLNDNRSSASYFLQSLNKAVFTDPELVQDNYLRIFNYLGERRPGFSIPKPLSFYDGTYGFYDENGNYWRFFEWVNHMQTISTVTRVEQAKEMAQTFGLFSLAFKGFNPGTLREALPHFHDLSYRNSQFQTAIVNALPSRIKRSKDLISGLKGKEHYTNFFEDIRNDSTAFPLRVMHHDAKISNILFHKDSGKVWGPVDLDTVMPGYFFSDIGDMIRSLAGSSEENDTNFSSLHIRKDYYTALIDGYTSVMEHELTPKEKIHLHAAGPIMIYMQAIRFLADHLTGDHYYKVSYPEQNFDRAVNQFTLLEILERFLLREYSYSMI